MQTPCEEGSLARRMIVRQPTAVKCDHEKMWALGENILTKVAGRLPIGRRLTTCPTPEYACLPRKRRNSRDRFQLCSGACGAEAPRRLKVCPTTESHGDTSPAPPRRPQASRERAGGEAPPTGTDHRRMPRCGKA